MLKSGCGEIVLIPKELVIFDDTAQEIKKGFALQLRG
jgi:hypothetical protein